MRGLAIASIVGMLAGCHGTASVTHIFPAPSGGALPAQPWAGLLLPAAGRHDAHAEADVGEVDFTNDGTFINEPIVRRHWTAFFGAALHIEVVDRFVPGFSFGAQIGKNAFVGTVIVLPLSENDGGDGSSTYRRENMRASYRRIIARENWFLEGGVYHGLVSAKWSTGTESVEVIRGFAGIGWRSQWGRSSNMYSDASLTFGFGESVAVAPAEGWADPIYIGQSELDPSIKATVIGVSF